MQLSVSSSPTKIGCFHSPTLCKISTLILQFTQYFFVISASMISSLSQLMHTQNMYFCYTTIFLIFVSSYTSSKWKNKQTCKCYVFVIYLYVSNPCNVLLFIFKSIMIKCDITSFVLAFLYFSFLLQNGYVTICEKVLVVVCMLLTNWSVNCPVPIFLPLYQRGLY